MSTDALLGKTAAIAFVVGEADLATALGSGDVPVLATPRLIAWLEAVTVAAVAEDLRSGETTVGTAVTVEHLAASRVGAVVDVVATVEEVEGRLVTFGCEAHSGETLVGRGRITRAVVNRQRFASRWG